MTKRKNDNNRQSARISTGSRDLDAILHGGIPAGAGLAVGGPPGSGKTILTQQICFDNATAERPALYFNTLSEPTAKSLRFLSQFAFFDAAKLERAVHFVDLGVILRTEGLESASELLMEHVKRVKPAIVVIDSFKVFDDLARSKEELRKFGYEIAVNLMAWEATSFFLGEYGASDFETNPLFSIVDGLVTLSQAEFFGEQQRIFRVVKMRGSSHSHETHPFSITTKGIEVFAPREAIRRREVPSAGEGRCKTGLPKLDVLLGPGIPWGSSLLLSGVAGTGKTVLSLEFLYRGALAGEKGIFVSFEETEERLRATARALGWDIEREIERGMLEILFIPQPEIAVDRHLRLMQERIETLGAKRVIVDSVSVFLHKIDDPQRSREVLFHLCSVVHNAQAVGLFATDIPYGSTKISRFGVEETVVDGVILLSATEEGHERERYIEIYKLRNTAHLKGRHAMVIGPAGLSIFPRYDALLLEGGPAPALASTARLSTGVPGLDELLGGGLLERSATIVSGSAGVGKTTLATQFILAGEERGIYVSLEEGPAQLLASADALELPLRAAVDEGRVEIMYLARAHIRAGQFLTLLADKLEALAARRLVFDAVTHLFARGVTETELGQILYGLVVRFKTLGVTSLLTLEASSLVSRELATERSLSPVADNLLMLRYQHEQGGLSPALTVVKTRGSAHDRRTHCVTIERGGMRVGPPTPEPASGARE
jgi:circadian clock protein KaiC